MAEADARFQGSIPAMYDRHLGPVIFEPYARDLARRVDVQAGQSVLETACGTGIVTRRLRERMPAGARLVATDLNQPMIDYARGSLGDPAGVEWQAADAMDLKFPAGTFDAVVMQFGLMFVPDKARAVGEARRMLAPGGLLALNVWDRLERNPFARIAHETIRARFPEDPPQFYKVPFGYADPEELRRELVAHGFGSVSVEHVQLELRAKSAEDFAIGLVEGNPVRIAIEERGGALPPMIDAIAAALAKECGAEPLVSTMQAWVATARAE
jgi:ubiquinone/menaquinone biosynthesis C-methylase UbiE